MNNVEFAIQMEIDGENYYREQAEKNKGNALEKVFLNLADDEKKHADLVKKYADAMDYSLDEKNAFVEFESVFKSESDFKVEAKVDPNQLDAYRLALKKEQESIDLYKKMNEEAETEKGKKLFDYLVRQEEYHYKIFDDMVQHLRKAEDWVEDARFGRRDTY
ncbi:ferritin-like domain-containing protein [Gudongella sp. DL1XJH-153]|uniref:ferritin-like domain-containing protein n=1 Tax=Gudongella sp. DL1XJH-153 TaxID=3409804 RepID=UPI003BB625F5